MNRQSRFYQGMETPWGSIQQYQIIADGLIQVETAGHGGLWLSDERMKALPKSYEPFTGTNRWAEEDEDMALVLQHFKLLSLIDEPMELHVTAVDIEIGRQTRKNFLGDPFYGGAIVEAFKRQTGADYHEMICNSTLRPYPVCYPLLFLPEDAQGWMRRCDAGEAVEPTTFLLEPYRVLQRVPFLLHCDDGKTYTDKVNGHTAEKIIAGDTDELDFYLQIYAKHAHKITLQDGTVIWERAAA